MKISDYPRNEKNPFVDKYVIIGGFKNKLEVDKIDANKGTDEEGYYNTKSKKKQVDPKRFIKIYPDSGNDWFDFSGNTCKVLFYIWKELLKPNQDNFFIDKKSTAKALGRSDKIVYNGLSELLKRGVIARYDSTNHFFININYFFNGSRMKHLGVNKQRYKQ